MSVKISIVIPVFNEQKSITKTLDLVFDTIGATKFDYELIVVNDCSKDKTKDILNKYHSAKKASNFYVIHHNINKGYGSSLKTGIKASSGEYILISDADGTYPIKEIPRLTRIALKKDYDMVVGSRTSKNVKIPLIRLPAKMFLNGLATFLAGKKIPDLNSGLRIFKKSMCLEFWKLYPKRFSFTSTITMASLMNGYKVKFTPIDYFRRQGSSSIKMSDFAKFLTLLMKLMCLFNPIKIFSLISLSFILFAVAIGLFSFFYLGRLMDATISIFVTGAIQIFLFGLIADLFSKYIVRADD